jgi:hypothetical protein
LWSAQNAGPIRTAARRFGTRLDDVEHRPRSATLAWPNDFEIDGLNPGVLQHQPSQLVFVDSESKPFQAGGNTET